MIDHEDLDRPPDGIPHAVVGLTAFYAVVVAVAFVLVLRGGGPSVAVLLGLPLPFLVWRLSRKAERERDHAHPSR